MAIVLSQRQEGQLCYSIRNELEAKRQTIANIAKAERYELASAEFDDLARAICDRVTGMLRDVSPEAPGDR